MPIQNRTKEQINEDMKNDFFSEFPDISQDEDNDITQLINTIAGVSEDLHYYLDRSLEEMFISRASREQSIRGLIGGLGYKLQLATESKGAIRVTFDGALTSDYLIPKGTIFYGTFDGLEHKFRTDVDTVITTGNTYADINITQGVPEVLATFTTDGSIFQRYLINTLDVNDGSIEVKIGNTSWTYKDSLINSGGLSKHFTLIETHKGTYILFGDNTYGLSPASGQTITATVRKGGGIKSNLPINIVTKSDIVIPDGYSITITQTSPITGGDDKETLDQAKIRAIQQISTLDRVVTKADYEIIISKYPGVAKGFAIGEREELTLSEANFNRIKYSFINSSGAIETDGSALQLEVHAELESKKMMELNLEYIEPTLLSVNISADIKVVNGSSIAVVTSQVNAALVDLYKVDNRFFGENLNPSDVMRAITNVPNVDYVLNLQLNSGTTNIQLTTYQFPQLGTVTLNVT